MRPLGLITTRCSEEECGLVSRTAAEIEPMWPLGFVPLVSESMGFNCIIFPSLEEIHYIPLTGRYTVILASIEAASVISTAIRILKAHVTTVITDSILTFPWFWTFTLFVCKGIISRKMKRLGQVAALCAPKQNKFSEDYRQHMS